MANGKKMRKPATGEDVANTISRIKAMEAEMGRMSAKPTKPKVTVMKKASVVGPFELGLKSRKKMVNKLSK